MQTAYVVFVAVAANSARYGQVSDLSPEETPEEAGPEELPAASQSPSTLPPTASPFTSNTLIPLTFQPLTETPDVTHVPFLFTPIPSEATSTPTHDTLAPSSVTPTPPETPFPPGATRIPVTQSPLDATQVPLTHTPFDTRAPLYEETQGPLGVPSHTTKAPPNTQAPSNETQAPPENATNAPLALPVTPAPTMVPYQLWCRPGSSDCKLHGDNGAWCDTGEEGKGKCVCSGSQFWNPEKDGHTAGVCLPAGNMTVPLVITLRWQARSCSDFTEALSEEIRRLLSAVYTGQVRSIAASCGSLTLFGLVEVEAVLAATLNLEQSINQELTSGAYNTLAALGAPDTATATAATGKCVVANASFTATDYYGRCNAVSCVLGSLLQAKDDGTLTCEPDVIPEAPVELTAPRSKRNWCSLDRDCREYGDPDAACDVSAGIGICVCSTSQYGGPGDVYLCLPRGQVAVSLSVHLRWSDAVCEFPVSLDRGLRFILEKLTRGRVSSTSHRCGSLSVYAVVREVPVEALVNLSLQAEVATEIDLQDSMRHLGTPDVVEDTTSLTPCLAPFARATVEAERCIPIECQAGYSLISDGIVSECREALKETHGNALSSGAVAGIILGGLLAVTLVVGAAVFSTQRTPPQRHLHEPYVMSDGDLV